MITDKTLFKALDFAISVFVASFCAAFPSFEEFQMVNTPDLGTIPAFGIYLSVTFGCFFGLIVVGVAVMVLVCKYLPFLERAALEEHALLRSLPLKRRIVEGLLKSPAVIILTGLFVYTTFFLV